MLTFSLALLAGCAKEELPITASTDTDAIALKGIAQARPLKSNFTFTSQTIIGDGSECGGDFTQLSLATGNMTHLGNTSVTSIGCVAIDFSCTSGLKVESNTGTWTAANGDEVYWEMAPACLELDFSCDNPLGPYPCRVLASTYSITGGTGRFEGASGSGDVHTLNYLVPDTVGPFPYTTGSIPVTGSFTGTIVY